MDQNENVILRLANEVLEQRISLDVALRDRVPALIQRGVLFSDLIDALTEALESEPNSLMCSYIARLCVEISSRGSFGGLAPESVPSMITSAMSPSAIHFAVANHLDERGDWQSLQLACEHYRLSRRGLQSTSEDYNVSLLHEGDARRQLADLGVDPLFNLERAIKFAEESRDHFEPDSQNFGIAEMNEAIAHDVIAMLGVEPRTHLEQALELYAHARSVFVRGTELFARTQFNEAAARVYLSDLQVDPLQSLNTAVNLCEDARETLSNPSPGFALALLNEGQARRGLAEWGERPLDNFQTAAFLFRQAQDQFTTGSYHWQLAVAGAAGTLRELAERGVNTVGNYSAALELTESLIESRTLVGIARAEQQIAAAILHTGLAQSGVNPELNLNEAIQLCNEARTGFDPVGRIHARALTNEGHAWLLKAHFGFSPEENNKRAFDLYEQSERAFPPETSGWAVARRNAARALWRLHRFTEAYERLNEGLLVLESGRGGLRTERERISFAQTISGQYEDATLICLDATAYANSRDEKDHWLREAWHQVHRAKNRALLDLLQRGKPRLRQAERSLWEELEILFKRLSECEKDIESHRRTVVRDRTEWIQRMNQLNAQHSSLIRSVEEKREQALKEIEDADVFLGTDVPSVESMRSELRQLAVRCSGPTHRPLLVEFFHLDTGNVLVFLAPLWNLDRLEVQQLSFPARFIPKIATDLLANTFSPETRAPARAASRLPDQTMTSILNEMSSLVEPWSDYLDNWQPTELIISPHSVLNLLPIHAATCRGAPLIEQFPIAYLPSPALASALLQRHRREVDTALLIGNPNADLENAEREVAQISKQFAGVQPFCREHATTECVQKYAAEANVVHLACHSEINHADFLRSGFLLSDRRMTVLEIMSSLELRRASLVYLSSCDSARPAVGQTEELMALARAFLYAGSPTIIASLWPLDDETGCTFAEHFYNAWLSEGVSMIRAFQTAMLRTRDSAPDPIYWAPFTMIGAW